MNGSESASAGIGSCESRPQPLTGNQFKYTPKSSSRAVPVTNDGSEMPISTSTSEATSNVEFRRTALMTPTGTPTSTAIRIAVNPSEKDTGSACLMICVHVQSRY